MSDEKIINLADRLVPCTKEELRKRIDARKECWYMHSEKVLELIHAADVALNEGKLAEAYVCIVMADSYILTE